MKQSKKLLSIFLAMLMLLGTVSVIGNAALAKNQVTYDSIDNAALSADQVAGIVLDMVDDMLKDIDMSDINDITSLLGVSLEFNSVDNAFKSIYGAKSVLQGSLIGGDIKKINVDAFNNKTRAKTGDIGMVVALLKFLADNFGGGMNIQKVIYGIGEDSKSNQLGVGSLLWNGKIIGISLGFSVKDIVNDPDLLGMGWSIVGILNDLSGFLKSLVFDMLMYGSYAYTKDGQNQQYSEVNSQFTGVTLDGMVDIILKNFLTTPQDYEYVPTGEVDKDGNPITKKVWDENSYLLSADKYAALGDLSLSNNSLFDFVDKVLQVAYEDFGTVFVNNDLKKNFMRIMGVDFIEVTDAAELAKIKADPDYIDVDKAAANKVALVKNYFCNAQMWEVDGTWYYRGYKTVETGEVDKDGNAVTVDKHVFQRADISGTDSFFNLVNWNFNLTATTLNFNDMIKTYGSIIGSLNHLLYVLFKNAVNVKALGLTSIDQIWQDGGNDKFNENLMTTAKFLLKEFTFTFFGRNEAYVDLNTFKATPAFAAKVDSFGNDAKGREGLIAYILLPMLGDVLPQLVYDMDMFTEGLQIEQTAALLVREFLSDLTPQINYDAEIFADASLASGRKFKTHTSAEWMDIILNMGLDLAMTYLDNITNINVTADGLRNLHEVAKSAGVPSWKVVLEEIVDWAVLYIGNGDNGALAGLSPNALGAVRCITDGTNTIAANYVGNAFNTISKALNTLLPLGLLCNVSSEAYALDVEMVFKRLIDVIDDLDLEVLLGTFGRNGRDDNILTSKNVLAQVLGLVNKLLSSIWGRTLIGTTTSLEGLLGKDNIVNLLINLIDGLYERSENLFRALLPTVAQFVPDWGGEQTFRAPSTSLDDSYNLSNGSRSDITFDITNGSKRLWRGYMKDGARVQDEQYKVTITDVKALNYDGSANSNVSITSKPSGTLDFSKSAQVKFNVSGVPAEGAIVRFDIVYTVTNGIDGAALPGTYTKTEIVAFNYSDSESYVNQTSKQQDNKVYTPMFVNIDDIGSVTGIRNVQLYREDASSGKTTQPAAVKVKSDRTQKGISFADVSADIKKDQRLDYNTLTVDKDAFAAANVKSGDSVKWSVEITAYEDKSTKEAVLYFYSGSELDQLRELVDSELNQLRLPENYDTSNAIWSEYLGAFYMAFAAAKQRLDGAAVGRLDYSTYYKNLEAAIAKVETIKKASSVDAMIDTLKATVNTVEKDLDGKNYRTFALYRWNRFYDVYSDANNVFALQEKVNLGLETKNFDYSPLTANEASTLVAKDAYKTYIEALFTAKTEEQAEEAKRDYNNAKNDLASYQMIDLANMNALLPALKDRLVGRDDGVINTYLKKEIDSAKAVVGSSQGNYSDMSWAVYTKALSDAEAAMNSKSQDTIFNAKYALQVARNNLVTKDNEADYTELKELIAQAENAVKNAASYKNAPVDFGRVLAALGYEVNGTEIFPGAAKDVVVTSYSKHDQDEVDDAADELKRALAKLEFKDFANKKPSGVTSTPIATGEQDATGNPVTENIYTKVIDAKQVKSAVASALAVSGCTVEVSLDDKYSAMSDANLEKVPVGTGATVTILQKVDGINVPVATIRLIVEGDVTGDGVIDALDCMIADLCANKQTSLDGVYLIAGDLQANNAVDKGDLAVIVNKAIPDKIA